MKLLLLFLAVLPVLRAQNLSTYSFMTTLRFSGADPIYELYWDFDNVAETISFAARVKTLGWVGFGLSPNGGMIGSDVVIGWVAPGTDGSVFFHDRYAVAQSLPPIDDSQDWTVLNGEEVDGYTIIHFTRSWVTCDDRDRDVTAQTARVVFSWNDNDPADADSAMYHGDSQRGSASLNLLGGLVDPPVEPADSDSFFIGVDTVEIPSDSDTTYWCAANRLPENLLSQTHYIYKFSPRITPTNTALVHHIIVYLCGALVDVTEGQSSPCVGAVGTSLDECRLGVVLGGWAVGGEEFIYPENVGYPIGGPGSSEFAVIEMHYDNPGLQSGVMDSSGIEFFYTATAPQLQVGQFSIGSDVAPSLMIPPNTESFTVLGLCSADCTNAGLPETGITIFANFFHTHLVGRGLVLQHFRMNQECNVLEELEPIDINLSYDFNYQQTTLLHTPRTVLPGDILLLRCIYDTAKANRIGVTTGGESTREEMCFAFPLYYPSAEFALCGSVPSFEAFNGFVQKAVTDPADRTAIQDVIDVEIYFATNTEQVQAAFNRLDWNREQVDALQQEFMNGDAITYCNTIEGNIVFGQEPAIPDVRCDYQAVDNCTTPVTIPESCCDRVGGSQLPGVIPSTTTVVISLIIVFAGLFFTV